MNTASIVEHSADITLQNVEAAQPKFCEIWPQAKSGLTLLASIIKNPIAKAAINVVIAAGDAVAKQLRCAA